ncbi:hypothetical protein B0H14DRAFT_3475469 [Mycena olivaceomarginata]|nr:hypothetical protein B0H14DRAFT_3475469 [Mycena olivaceomarginata]
MSSLVACQLIRQVVHWASVVYRAPSATSNLFPWREHESKNPSAAANDALVADYSKYLPSIQTSISTSTPAFSYACILCCSRIAGFQLRHPPRLLRGTQHTPASSKHSVHSASSGHPAHPCLRRNTQSDDGTSDTDNLVTAADAAAALRILSEDKIRYHRAHQHLIGTKDGQIANQTGATLISKSKVMYPSTRRGPLTTSEWKGPRVYRYADAPFNVGFQHTDQGVSGIVLPIPVWPNMRFQVALSSGTTTIEVHDAIDKRWEGPLLSTLPDITQKKTTNGPTSVHVSAGRRPVFVTNATTLDCRSIPEYEEKFKLLPFFGERDLRYN